VAFIIAIIVVIAIRKVARTTPRGLQSTEVHCAWYPGATRMNGRESWKRYRRRRRQRWWWLRWQDGSSYRSGLKGGIITFMFMFIVVGIVIVLIMLMIAFVACCNVSDSDLGVAIAAAVSTGADLALH
jgi:hypothetical protein